MDTKRAFQILDLTLVALGMTLSAQATTLERNLSDLQHQLNSIGIEMETLRKVHLEEATVRRRFLDTEDIESLGAQHVTGALRLQHVHKGIAMPPKLVFNIETKFPLRATPVFTQSDSLKWMGIKYMIGNNTFEAWLKPKLFRDGWAEILLYGWRKEIHGAEIEQLSKNISELKRDIATREDMAKAARDDIATRETALKKANERLGTCRGDTEKLRNAARHMNTIAHPLVNAQSVSALARALGLKSTARFGDIRFSPTVDDVRPATEFAKGFRELLSQGRSYLALRANERDALRQSIEFQIGRAVNIVKESGDQAIASSISDLAPIPESEGSSELLNAARADLEQLDEDLSSIVTEDTRGILECDAQLEIDQDRLSQLSVDLVQTQNEIDALAETFHQMKVDKHIGVVAALRVNKGDMVKGLLDLYRGNLVVP